MRSTLQTLALALLLVLCAELLARVVVGPDDDWRYWRHSVGERIDLYNAHDAIDVLFVGDSTAEANLVPDAFDRASGQTSFNLGTAANMPLSWRETVMDGILTELPRRPRTLIVSFTARGYVDAPSVLAFEQLLRASTYARARRGERIWADWFALARLTQHFRRWEPHQGVDPTLEAARGWRPWERTQADNRTKANTRLPPPPWGRAERAGGGASPLVQDRLDVLPSLAKAFPDLEIIVLLPPGSKGLARRVAERLRGKGITVWDDSAGAYKTATGSHLHADEARRYSTMLGQRYRTAQ